MRGRRIADLVKAEPDLTLQQVVELRYPTVTHRGAVVIAKAGTEALLDGNQWSRSGRSAVFGAPEQSLPEDQLRVSGPGRWWSAT